MNQSGQEFSGFRLLIDAILVLMILVIIIGILGWVDSLRFQISEKRLYEGFNKSLNSPDGKTVVEKDITMRSGTTYLVGAFAGPGVDRDCIRFRALNLTAWKLSSNKKQLDIETDIVIDVFYQCTRQFDEGACEILCEISFGDEFEED
ncbi:MAG: hypothetical protein CL943_03540 [Candidatus Diapherotrites archaeon]|uniref:Class III signal peptide-containing protein n=1 Tax=Candidatus Iainarchaeum sp. TaxID=3101447 RepID=A0A2D6M1R0_9ARCH|nr:hypothetical protein [Candidatus Diapherotrites archaeon]|tara:strand:- start:859 stop:1302 length:444 start_codon:yes stop_codon:yes gene_type:complete